jgi:hypothetical protein
MRKGGSIASNAVSGLVTDGAYNALSRNFSNSTNSGKCGGKVRKSRKLRGGDVFTNVSSAVTKALSSSFTKPAAEGFNVFRSVSAPVNSSYGNLKGNTPVSGGKTQNISHYMNNSSEYNVRNKRGGSEVKTGLDYSIIPTSSKLVGNSSSRAMSSDVVELKASESVSSFPAMAKEAYYGSVIDSSTQNFNYAGTDKIIQGGKRKRPVAKKAKKPVAKKPKAKKPKAKKPKAKK